MPKIYPTLSPRMKTGCGNLYANFLHDGNKVTGCLPHMSKSGGCATAMLQAVYLLLNLAIEKGASTKEIVDRINNVGCFKPIKRSNGVESKSCIDALAQALREVDSILEEKRKEGDPVGKEGEKGR